jgi:putative ABC transport system substrate-binding protein
VPNHVRIGTLTPTAVVAIEESLRDGLSGLGYIEGRNLTTERKRGDSEDTLRLAARELVAMRVDAIVAFGTQAARAAISVTSSIPIVFISGDPVGTGLVSSLARPGRNATGVSTLNVELIPKRLELLQRVLPQARRVMLLTNPNSALHGQVLKNAQIGAAALHIRLFTLDARNENELEAALHRIRHEDADALIPSTDVLFLSNRGKIAEAVAKAKLPAMFPWPDHHDARVLMAYGSSATDMGHRVASYLDRIFKGANPGDLPIEQLSKYELVISMRAAKDLGIQVPQEILLRADEVVQ